ncbi:MAG: RpoL/Rpb11 RNA polymerase subunit family protein [Candidatus Aenigmatarchaeota archaeon]
MINIIKDENEKMIIESDDLTAISLINEYLWHVKGVRFAGFAREHPFLTKPKLVINAVNPRLAINSAIKKILKDIDDLKEQLKK